MVDLNTNNVQVGPNGQVRFVGSASGIDTQAIVDNTIQARRAQAVQYERQISENTQEISALNELKTVATDFRNVTDRLRGSTSFFADNTFDKKQGFLTSASTSTAPGDHTPSEAGQLMGAAVSQKAQTGTHRITIEAVAQAHQLRSDALSSATDNLVDIGITAGDFELNGQTITIGANDSLLDLRNKINDADSGVSASIVTASPTEHYLVLAADDTGLANEITFDAAATTTSLDLGFQDGTNAIKNELQGAADAELTVNGIGGITRGTNEIDDIIEGVTLSLAQAEPDTELTLTIERDLNAIKTDLTSFVDSYNAMRDFIEDQRAEIDRDPEVDADDDGDPTNDTEFGPLAFSSILRSLTSQLNSTVSSSVSAAADGFQSLGQIGIKVDSDFKLTIDEEELDNKLLTGAREIKKLFEVDVSASDSRVAFSSVTSNTVPGTYYVGIDGTDADGNVLGGQINTAPSGATAPNGSLAAEGQGLTGTSQTNAQGLALVFNGGANAGPVADVEVTVSRGLGDQLYQLLNDATKLSGILDLDINAKTSENERLTDRIETIDARLVTVRQNLENKFFAMETALAQLESLRNTVTQFIDAQNANS